MIKRNLLQEKLMETVQEIREAQKRYAWILLKAGTGQGKTTAIIEGLLPYAMRRQEKILYIVNRKALKVEITNRLRRYAAMNSENLGLINYIRVVSYQEIEQRILGVGKTVINRGEYDYIVADEIHYLSSDSQFNTNTQLSFEWLMKFDANVIKIFMSATPEKMEGFIYSEMIKRDKRIREGEMECFYDVRCHNSLEKDMLYMYGIGQQNCPILYKIGQFEETDEPFVIIKKVDLQTSYSYINPHVLTDDKAAVSAVLKIDHKEKIIIFVPSITEGNKILENLKKEEMDVEFVNSSYRWDDETKTSYNHISEFHKSKSRILISTAVIDNGIDIIDLACHHVFIFATEQEAFLQMLGRRRMREGEVIDLYIMNRNDKYLNNKCIGQQAILDVYNLCEDRNLNEMLYILFQQKYIDHDVFRKLYFYDCSFNCFRINELALQRTYRLQTWYQELAEDIKCMPDDFIFAKEQLAWLGISFNESMVFNANVELERAEKELMGILESKQEKEMFFEGIQELIKNILPSCRTIKRSNDNIFADIHGGKVSWKKINEFLKQGGYSYCIKEKEKNEINNQRKKTYIIKKMN